MHQGRRLQGVTRALSLQKTMRQPTELVIDQRQQLLERLLIASAPLIEQSANLICRSLHHSGLKSRKVRLSQFLRALRVVDQERNPDAAKDVVWTNRILTLRGAEKKIIPDVEDRNYEANSFRHIDGSLSHLDFRFSYRPIDEV